MDIELTPTGLLQPGGPARVNAAVEAQRDAITNVANITNDLLDALRDSAVRLPANVREIVEEAREAVTRRRDADEEFLRALSGHPPRPVT